MTAKEIPYKPSEYTMTEEGVEYDRQARELYEPGHIELRGPLAVDIAMQHPQSTELIKAAILDDSVDLVRELYNLIAVSDEVIDFEIFAAAFKENISNYTIRE